MNPACIGIPQTVIPGKRVSLWLTLEDSFIVWIVLLVYIVGVIPLREGLFGCTRAISSETDIGKNYTRDTQRERIGVCRRAC